MNELLFFVLGFIIGGLALTTLMCFLQVKHVNELEKQLFIKNNKFDEE